MARPKVSIGGRPRVFVSYARQDAAIADWIAEGLVINGFETLVDRAEIGAFEDWWERLKSLIVRADTVIFLISERSVASRVCREEIAFAASLNKRFAPVIVQTTPEGSIPDELKKLHFVRFDGDRDANEALAELCNGLTTNLTWIRDHTRFGEAARQWDAGGRSRGLLLRTPLLQHAERWQRAHPPEAPEPTTLHAAFIRASRRGFYRRVGTRTVASSLMALFVGANATFAWKLHYDPEFRRVVLNQAKEILFEDSKDGAGSRLEQAEDILRGLLERHKATPTTALKIDLWRAHDRVATIYTEIGDRFSAASDWGHAYAMAREVHDADPANDENVERLIRAAVSAGGGYAMTGNQRRMNEAHATAIRLFTEMERRGKTTPHLRNAIVSSYIALAGPQIAVRETLAQGAENAAAGLKQAELAYAAEPNVLAVRMTHATALAVRGQVDILQDQKDAGRLRLKRAREEILAVQAADQKRENYSRWLMFIEGVEDSIGKVSTGQ